MNCSHPYSKQLAPDARVCLSCGHVIKQVQTKARDGEALIMPPVVYMLTPEYWETVRPWPLIGYETAKKFGWYISFIWAEQYLVMPVFQKGKGPVFYSARRLTKNEGDTYPKYLMPKERSKHIWIARRRTPWQLISEGVADAAHLAGLGHTSIALLGSHGKVPAKSSIILMDSDAAGISASFEVAEQLRKAGVKKRFIVRLPQGKDPTDLTLTQLRALIKAQTGARL